MIDLDRTAGGMSGIDYMLYGVTVFGWSTSWIAIH
jgi:hypothetical protein